MDEDLQIPTSHKIDDGSESSPPTVPFNLVTGRGRVSHSSVGRLNLAINQDWCAALLLTCK